MLKHTIESRSVKIKFIGHVGIENFRMNAMWEESVALTYTHTRQFSYKTDKWVLKLIVRDCIFNNNTSTFLLSRLLIFYFIPE